VTKTYGNQSALATRLGVNQQRIAKLIRDQEWRWPKNAPWSEKQAAQMDAWLSDRRASNNFGASRLEADAEEDDDESAIRALSKNPERIARIKLIIERTAKIKLEREMLSGGLMKREEVERQWLQRVYSVRAKMQEIPLRASLIAIKSEAECERILTDWMREVCEYYANGGN